MKRRVHRLVTQVQRDAGGVVTTTERFAAVLRERGLANVVVIRNGTDLQRYEHVAPAPGAQDELRVLYIGTVGRSQGLSTLIEAAARLRAIGVPIVVRVVGDGADGHRLRRLNDLLGRPAQLFTAVAASDVAGHYDWTDSIIVSLRDWEPFSWTVPSKLYEALATGKHVTGLLRGEAAEIVAASGGGDVTPPGDVEELVALWARLAADRSGLVVGDAGKRWVQEHANYDMLAGRYSSMLASVYDTADPRPTELGPGAGTAAGQQPVRELRDSD